MEIVWLTDINHCFLICICILLVLLQKSSAYPAQKMSHDQTDEHRNHKSADLDSDKLGNNKIIIERLLKTSKTTYDLMFDEMERYIRREHNENHENHDNTWIKYKRDFHYPPECENILNLEIYKGKLPINSWTHLNKPEPPTTAEIISELKIMYTCYETLKKVFQRISKDRETNKDSILIDVNFNTTRYDDMNESIRENIEGINNMITAINSICNGLGCKHTVDDSKISESPVNSRSIREWIAIREHMKLQYYSKHVFCKLNSRYQSTQLDCEEA